MQIEEPRNRPIKDPFYAPIRVYHKAFKRCFSRLPAEGKLKTIILRVFIVLFAVVLYPLLGLYAILGRKLTPSQNVVELETVQRRRVEARFELARQEEEGRRVLEQAKANIAALEKVKLLDVNTEMNKMMNDFQERMAKDQAEYEEQSKKWENEREERLAQRKEMIRQRAAARKLSRYQHSYRELMDE